MHRYFSAVASLSLCCRSAAVSPAVARQLLLLSPPLLLLCRSAVAPLSLRCRSAIAQLSLCCRFYRSVASDVAPAVATLSLLISLLLTLHCHSCCCSDVALLPIRYHSVISPTSLCCCSAASAVTPAVAPAIALAVTPLLLL